MAARPERGTSTRRFGTGRRESHDASEFYARFVPPDVSSDDDVYGVFELDEPLKHGDSRKMAEVPPNSVALVVTSPPYFVGKEYEEALGHGDIPASYLDFLQLLRDVFAECRRVLEPGGRIAVNVANLGRKPYRSLSADVIRILQDDLGLLLRGEIIWAKAGGAAGSCAWGSFRSAANPVLRDITERVIIASKGRFERARTPEQRQAEGLPWKNMQSNDEFMEATLDLWRIDPESARRVGHPAPFPIELPQRLIDLYTYVNDLVLDPFLGSGTTAVAAASRGRRYAGYDTNLKYVEIARGRVAEELEARKDARLNGRQTPPFNVALPAPISPHEHFQARATEEGKAAQAIAESVLQQAGFEIVRRNHKLRGIPLTVNFVATDAAGKEWYFDVSGAFTTTRGGLLRTDTMWKSLGRAHVLAKRGITPVVLLTSHLPKRRSLGDQALRGVGVEGFFDAIEMYSDEGQARLVTYALGNHHRRPLPGFWTRQEMDADS
ncbi:MAG TPA: site-specific DNA-methyltransferase [Actinomycetota bacterium]|nr:site-specific DNA-methyltransferase [Actinomycetota bacterium]